MQSHSTSISDSKEPQEAGSYIYKSMDPHEAAVRLKDRVNSLTADQLNFLKSNPVPLREGNKKIYLPDTMGSVAWLLRESREDGMLTIESIAWSDDEKWHSIEPQRIALTPSGWVNANLNDQALKELKAIRTRVKLDDYATHATQLLKFLQQKFKLKTECRINPRNKAEQSQNKKYEGYSDVGYSAEEEKKPINPVTPPFLGVISSALTCFFTEEILIDPVVCTFDDPRRSLIKGQSYERAILAAMGLEEEVHFYPNIKLKNIIGSLMAKNNQLAELEKIDGDEINDPVNEEKLLDTVITPAGQTYSRSVINLHIATQIRAGQAPKDPLNPDVSIGEPSLISNLNLNLFMSNWDSYYKERRAELLAEQKAEPPQQQEEDLQQQRKLES